MRAFSLLGFSPPATAPHTREGIIRARSDATFSVWSASSLVGERTVANVPFLQRTRTLLFNSLQFYSLASSESSS